MDFFINVSLISPTLGCDFKADNKHHNSDICDNKRELKSMTSWDLLWDFPARVQRGLDVK